MANQDLKNITYLNLPYAERNEAKTLAGKLSNGENALGFDPENKLWYAKEGADLKKLEKWLPNQHRGITTDSGIDPIVEFSDTLKAAGFVLDGPPVMDGRKHRVKTIEDKQGQKSGVYVGYLDQAKPAGWYQNYRSTDNIVKWVASGKELDKEAQANQLAIMAQRKHERDLKQAALFSHTSKRVTQLYSLLPDATLDHPYLQKKQIKSLEALKGIKLDKKNRLVIPIRSVDGNIMSIQRIDENGYKRIKKDSQKSGNFFVVGGELPQPLNGEKLIYAEGYSTAASISSALGKPVIMTVDAGNLPTVVKNMCNIYLKDEHLVFSDNDAKSTDNKNKGQVKANEAVEYINKHGLGMAVNVYPSFSDVELEQGNTDFNDLYILRGEEAIQKHYAIAVTQLQSHASIEEKNSIEITPQEQEIIKQTMEEIHYEHYEEDLAL